MFYIVISIIIYICIFVFGIVGNGISISLSGHTNWKIDNKVDFDFNTANEMPRSFY